MLDQGLLVGGDGYHRLERADAARLSTPGSDMAYRLTPRGRETGTLPGKIVATGRDTEKLTALETEMSEHLGYVAASVLGSGAAGVVRRAVGEHIVHVHFGPGLEAAHHLVQ
ncbi:MAG: hypothetical protein QOG95_4131 [Mycobacterium sp.]|jgi:hypothetical protein|nr:hypothetical protein [Mycobacterium sp.]